MKDETMHVVQLSESAFSGFQRLAEQAGVTVDEYLNSLGEAEEEAGEFVMTPEIRAGIEAGLAQSARGEVHTMDEVRSHVTQWRKQWAAEHEN